MRFAFPVGLALLSFVLIGPGRVAAMDVGRPILASDSPWSAEGATRYSPWSSKAEFCYERLDRRIDYTIGGGSTEDDVRLDVFSAKAYFPVVRYAFLYFDVGMFRNSDMDAVSPLVGVGSYFAPIPLGNFVLYSIAGVRYLSSIEEYHRSGGSTTKSDEQWWEYSVGEMLSIDLRVSDDFMVQPYAGAILSAVDGSGHVERVSDEGQERKSYRLRQDSWAVGIVGVSVVLGGQVSLRAEGHVLGDKSLSAALGYAF